MSTIGRVIFRLVYVVFLLFASFMFYSFWQDLKFAQGDLQRWQEAPAKVTESRMTGESLELKRDRRTTGTGAGRRTYYEEYKEYTVRYAYKAEFSAWGKVFKFEHEGSNRGKLDKNADRIPAHAYNYPKRGDTVAVIFNPDADGEYRVGSKASWQEKGEVSFTNLNLIIPCVFLAVAVLLFFIDVAGSRKRRRW